MTSGINRRGFLKFAAATGVLIASGEALSGAMAPEIPQLKGELS